MTIAIEPADARDIAAMLEIMAAAFEARFGEAWSGPQLLGSLGLPGTWVRIARDAGSAPVGFVLTRHVADEAELLLVAVVPAQRGHGLGRRLITDAAALAYQRGAARLFLEVRAGNDAAVALYRVTGFSVVGRRANYYAGAHGERFDAITMRRDLTDDS